MLHELLDIKRHPYEPTANLDGKGIDTLIKQLKHLETMVIVSHDRTVLNALCTRIVEIVDGEVISYDGNYDDYEAKRQERKAARQA